MPRHMQGYYPDNQQCAPLTIDEMKMMFCDDWLSGTACETCAHRVTIDCGKELFKGYERKVEIDVCVAPHDGGYAGDCIKLTSKTVQDTCGEWDMEE